MGISAKQIILLFIEVLVPVVLLYQGRRRQLLGWVGFTLMVQVFDTAILTNLPAGRAVGLVHLAWIAPVVRQWLSVKPVRCVAVNAAYLVVLALIFGFLFPWPDITGSRPLTLLASGRSVVYLVRLLSDLSLSLFVASELTKAGGLDLLIKSMIAGGTLTGLVGCLEVVTKVDAYNLITDLTPEIAERGRPRGLSYEPRGMGLACSYAILLFLAYVPALGRRNIALLLANAVSFFAANSTSALVAFGAGICTMWVFLANQIRRSILLLAAGAVALLITLQVVRPDWMEYNWEFIKYRIQTEDRLMGAVPQTVGETIAFHLDVFDAGAMLFLFENPTYALIGTGPGLMPLPASYHVLPGIYRIHWPPEVGLNSMPFHGVLIDVSNSGLVGLVCLCLQITSSMAAFRRLVWASRTEDEAQHWRLGRAAFLIGVAAYVAQNSVSPVWPVMQAVGFAAAFAARTDQMAADPASDQEPVLVAPAGWDGGSFC